LDAAADADVLARAANSPKVMIENFMTVYLLLIPRIAGHQ